MRKKLIISVFLFISLIFQQSHIVVAEFAHLHKNDPSCVTAEERQKSQCTCCIIQQAEKSAAIHNSRDFHPIQALNNNSYNENQTLPAVFEIQPKADPPAETNKWLKTTIRRE